MNKPLEWSTTLYINGTPHRITEMAESFYADLPDMPSRRCSYHHIGASALGALRSGQAVRTLGNTYSMMKPLVPEEEHPVAKPKRQKTSELTGAALDWAVAKVAKPKRQSMKQRALIGVRNWCNKQLSKGESK